jgi:hypothetical protein
MIRRREFITLLGGDLAARGGRAAGRARSAYWRDILVCDILV